MMDYLQDFTSTNGTVDYTKYPNNYLKNFWYFDDNTQKVVWMAGGGQTGRPEKTGERYSGFGRALTSEEERRIFRRCGHV